MLLVPSSRYFGSGLQVAQGQKLTWDGATAAKYFSSDGTTLTLTGLNLLAPNVNVPQAGKLTFDGATASKYLTSDGTTLSANGLSFRVDAANNIFWSTTGNLGFTCLNNTLGVRLSSCGGSNGNAAASLPGLLYKSVTAGNNGTTVDTTLDSYTLPGGTMNTSGRGVRITAWGSFAANGNTKTVRLKFGATDLAGGAFTGAINSGTWSISAVVFRTAATTQTATCSWGASTGPVNRIGTVATPGETLASDLVIALTGQSGTASNDITSAALMVEYLG